MTKKSIVIFEVGYFCLSLVLSQALSNEHLSNVDIIILTTTGLFPVNVNPWDWIDQKILGHILGELTLCFGFSYWMKLENERKMWCEGLYCQYMWVPCTPVLYHVIRQTDNSFQMAHFYYPTDLLKWSEYYIRWLFHDDFLSDRFLLFI